MKKWIGGMAALTLLSTSIVLLDADAKSEPKKPKVELGVDRLMENPDILKGKRVGLITNPTGINAERTSIVDLFDQSDDFELTALYGPEHGVRGDAQAGSTVSSYIDEVTGLPVYSLYGATKKPTPDMLEDVDVLVFDIQDVGTRYYTYIYTMAYAMEAASENGIPFVVLDRPNPQGGLRVDGPVLDPDYASFIGLYPIPLKHGMTVGELAQLFNSEYHIQADLEVVKMKGWKRSMMYEDTGLPFVMPSPNMPTTDTVNVYPATGLFEGTNLSEGRGTTKPFQLIGAPYIQAHEYAKELNKLDLPGVAFRAASFTPTFSKHAGKLTHGVEVYVTDPTRFESTKTGIAMIQTAHDLYPDDFEFLANDFITKLTGNAYVKDMILEGASLDEILTKIEDERDAFLPIRKDYLMYK
ncbi:exo-beta-N-acetylmuramidase NamZ family protein [Exiguobacterium sp. NPDC077395]|uniref:exo-beta-N-acetylmuramidase NamZ family protein n=1 Tax=Exiguobacterium sp. NPDC077395 TaxID=3390563 RepID=UPI003CFE3D80